MKKNKPTGIGDVIKNVTESLGIEQCEGCTKRQEILNSVISFTTKSTEITDEAIGVLMRLKGITINSNTDRYYLFALYNRVFNTKEKVCQCQDKMQELILKLLNVNAE